MQSLWLNCWAQSLYRIVLTWWWKILCFPIQPIYRCFCKHWSISIKTVAVWCRYNTYIEWGGKYHSFDWGYKRVGVGFGSFNGRPTTVCWNNNYEDYLFLIDMPFLTMKRTIIPRTAHFSYAQYAIEIKRALCKMSKNSHISAKTLFLCQRLYQRTIILALNPLNSPV